MQLPNPGAQVIEAKFALLVFRSCIVACWIRILTEVGGRGAHSLKNWVNQY
jgi:hypothetical protein